MGVQHVGYLTTNTGKCTVTVVSQWLAITAKHCGWVNASLKLNVAATSTPGVVPIKKIEVNRDLDVEAIFLEHPTGLEVTRVRRYVTRSDRLSFWGYGDDHSNNETNWLTRAEFDPPTTCPADLRPDQGSLCWHTTATHSVCHGDSGGPVLQNGTIVGMLVSVQATPPARPDGSIDCSRVVLGQAIKVQEMRTWLDQMIKDAERAS